MLRVFLLCSVAFLCVGFGSAMLATSSPTSSLRCERHFGYCELEGTDLPGAFPSRHSSQRFSLTGLREAALREGRLVFVTTDEQALSLSAASDHEETLARYGKAVETINRYLRNPARGSLDVNFPAYDFPPGWWLV